MNLILKTLWQKQQEVGDEHELIADTEHHLTELELWLQNQESICYFGFDDFDIWS